MPVQVECGARRPGQRPTTPWRVKGGERRAGVCYYFYDYRQLLSSNYTRRHHATYFPYMTSLHFTSLRAPCHLLCHHVCLGVSHMRWAGTGPGSAGVLQVNLQLSPPVPCAVSRQEHAEQAKAVQSSQCRETGPDTMPVGPHSPTSGGTGPVFSVTTAISPGLCVPGPLLHTQPSQPVLPCPHQATCLYLPVAPLCDGFRMAFETVDFSF